MARTAEQAAEVLSFYATHDGPVFAAARLSRLEDLRALQAASDHANRLDYKGQARQRHDGDASKTLRYNPYLCGRIENPGRPFDYVADFKAMKARRGVVERKGTAPVSHVLFIISPHWVIKEGGVHDPHNPRNRAIFEGAIDWARQTFGADALLSARMDMDELGGGMVDLFVCPTAKHKKKDNVLSISPRLKKLQEDYKRSKTYQALQDSVAEYAQKSLDSTIQRGKEKEGKRGDDYLTPDNFSARADNKRERERLEKLAAEVEGQREAAEAEAARLAQLEADQTIAREEAEVRLAARESALSQQIARVAKREAAVAADEARLAARERAASTQEARTRARDESATGRELRAKSKEARNQSEDCRLSELRTELDRAKALQTARARTLAQAESDFARTRTEFGEQTAASRLSLSEERRTLEEGRRKIEQDKAATAALKEKATVDAAEAARMKEEAQATSDRAKQRLEATTAETAAIKRAANEELRNAKSVHENAKRAVEVERIEARARGFVDGRAEADKQAVSKYQALQRVLTDVADGSIYWADPSGEMRLGRTTKRSAGEIEADFAVAAPLSGIAANALIEKQRELILKDYHERQAMKDAVQKAARAACSGVLQYDATSKILSVDTDTSLGDREGVEAALARAPIVREIAVAVVEARKSGFTQGLRDGARRALDGFRTGVQAFLEGKLSFQKSADPERTREPQLAVSTKTREENDAIQKAIKPVLSAGLRDLLFRLHSLAVQFGITRESLKRAAKVLGDG